MRPRSQAQDGLAGRATHPRLSTLQAILAIVLALLTGYVATIAALWATRPLGLPSGGELLVFQALSSVGAFILWRRVLLKTRRKDHRE